MFSDKLCVICRDDAQTSSNPFMSPCDCKGSMSIHLECLENLISHSHADRCSVCHIKYRIRYNKEISFFIGTFFQSLVFFLVFMTISISFFFITNRSTYQFNANILESTSLYFFTTYIHIGLYLWYISVILTSVLFFVCVFVAIFSGDSNTERIYVDVESWAAVIKQVFSSTYPFKHAVASIPVNHIFCALFTLNLVYAIYRVLLWKNPPKKRIQIS